MDLFTFIAVMAIIAVLGAEKVKEHRAEMKARVSETSDEDPRGDE